MDGHWAAAAAGHVEKGETAHDAARREALEEIDVSDLDLAFVTSMQRTRGGEPIDELQVLRDIIDGEIEPYTTFGFPSHGRDR